MSGHQPETMACGVLSCVVDLLSELSGVPWLDVYGLFFFPDHGKHESHGDFHAAAAERVASQARLS
jgi:hypothetical protein